MSLQQVSAIKLLLKHKVADHVFCLFVLDVFPIFSPATARINSKELEFASYNIKH